MDIILYIFIILVIKLFIQKDIMMEISDSLINFNVYTYWPNIPKIKKSGISQFDYIALSFEISFPTNTSLKKEETFSLVFYLFIDYHDNKFNVSFDIPHTEDNGSFHKTVQKIFPQTKFRKIIVQDQDIISLKKEKIHFIPHHDNQQLQDSINQFFKEHFQHYSYKILDFLDKHNISYDNYKTNSFLYSFQKDFLFQFTEDNIQSLSTQWHNKVKETNSFLFSHNLNTLLDQKNNIVKCKLKI